MASNLEEATREYVDMRGPSAVSYGMPLFTRLMERDQLWPGGLAYQQIVENADSEGLVQEYGPNDNLTGGTVELFDKPEWKVAYLQVPVEVNVDESVMNLPKTDARLLEVAARLGDNALRSMKQVMNKRVYGSAADAEVDSRHTYLQGLCSALTEDTTYGTLARSGSTTNEWWQAADYANWDTAAVINKSNLDEWIDSVVEYADSPQDILIVMGPTLFNRLKAIFDANNHWEVKGSVAAQGFESMTYNGVEIAKDFTLDRMTSRGYSGGSTNHKDGTAAGLDGSGTYTGDQFVFVLDLSTWHLRYMQKEGEGQFHMTNFFEQSQIIGGKEKTMARIKWKGNLTCDLPNRNLMRANVS